MTEKSILEQALLQVQTLEEAVKQNAKGILASTMKEELSELLKESEEEEQKDDEMAEGDVPPAQDEVSEEPEEEEKDMSEQPEDEESDEESEDEEGSEENTDDLDNEEPMKDIESMDSEGDESEDEMGMDDMSSDEMGMDDMSSDEEDVMDMTGASDEEVLKVFKAMKPEDGIVVKKDGEDIELDMDGDEYIIKLDGEEESEMSEEMDFEVNEEDSDETIYEIELDEEDEVEIEASEGEDEEEPKEVEATEAARTFANDVRTPANQGKKYKAGRHEMNEEVENLKKQNAEYKKALVLFKEKLNEVAVFNANLAYATRLFTEHSTTKQEKLNILKRFDSVSTMNESKNLFNTIKSELGVKKPVTESVVDKISSTPQSSSSKEVLAESKAYENPQFARMKDLMRKVK
jgi:hypothetical protein